LKPDFNFRFIHVGGGDDLQSLKDLSMSLSLDDRIAWRGPLAQGEILDLYRQADIFTLACRISDDGDRDGLPNVLVEAASQALVCVSTDVSGIPELLTDGVDGLIVPPEDHVALAAALKRLIRDPEQRHRLGTAAEQRVRQHFDHLASIKQLVNLFRSDWRNENRP
jgi:glycosyltransferase involved in cell wall biosynthesis